MAALDFVDGTSNEQVTIYHTSGAVSTAQKGIREKDNGISELTRMTQPGTGWSTTPPAQTNTGYNYEKGLSVAKALYSFFPEDVTKEFAKAWVKFGDADTAAAAVRNTGAWKKHFSYLEREDGTLIMTELEALSTIATFRNTLAEVGISDTSMFEGKFKDMITAGVSGVEFQDRIDLVWKGVKDQIPEVEQLFRERYGIDTDGETIFAALIDPDIEDKLLKGEIATLNIAAEAKAKGFSVSFNRFDDLRKRGLTVETAKSLYGAAEGIMSRASTIGRDLDITTLEEAALGTSEATRRVKRIEAELLSTQGLTLGAAKKGDEITGLVAD